MLHYARHFLYSSNLTPTLSFIRRGRRHFPHPYPLLYKERGTTLCPDTLNGRALNIKKALLTKSAVFYSQESQKISLSRQSKAEAILLQILPYGLPLMRHGQQT